MTENTRSNRKVLFDIQFPEGSVSVFHLDYDENVKDAEAVRKKLLEWAESNQHRNSSLAAKVLQFQNQLHVVPVRFNVPSNVASALKDARISIWKALGRNIVSV